MAHGSITLMRPKLHDYCLTREELLWRGHEVFAMLLEDATCAPDIQVFPLASAADGHRLLEARGTKGMQSHTRKHSRTRARTQLAQ